MNNIDDSSLAERVGLQNEITELLKGDVKSVIKGLGLLYAEHDHDFTGRVMYDFFISICKIPHEDFVLAGFSLFSVWAKSIGMNMTWIYFNGMSAHFNVSIPDRVVNLSYDDLISEENAENNTYYIRTKMIKVHFILSNMIEALYQKKLFGV